MGFETWQTKSGMVALRGMEKTLRTCPFWFFFERQSRSKLSQIGKLLLKNEKKKKTS